MSSWTETQYEPRPNPPYLYQDHPDAVMPDADHAPSMRTTGYSVTPHLSHNSSRQTYNSGLYGPRPIPGSGDQTHGVPTPTIAYPAAADLYDAVANVYTNADADIYADADAETMELDPGTDHGPIYESEFDDVPRSRGTRRFVGGFIRGLRKIPRAMRRGFLPHRRGAPTTPASLAYQFQSPYHAPYTSDNLNSEFLEQPEDPPYDDAAEYTEGEMRYSEDANVPPSLSPAAGPSRSMSHAVRSPRIESQPTYQSLTNPSSLHHSQHGSLHNGAQRPPLRTVRNPDPASTTEEGSEMRTIPNFNSPQPSQYPAEPEPSPHGTSHISPLDPTRRPTVTVQSPTGSPIYVEPQLADDYAGMDTDVEPPPEPSVPSQFARIGKFFRDLNSLPWVSPNVTVDFTPEEPGRGGHSHPIRGTGRSWYTGHLHDLDLLGGGGGSSSTRRLTAPSGHSLAHVPGSSATLAPAHGSGSASSSEAASTHLPAQHATPVLGLPPSSYPPYAVPQLAMPSQPLYFFPASYPTMPQPSPSPQRGPGPGPGPSPIGADHTSPQSSGNSDGVPRQPYFYVVAMPPTYVGGPVDPSRQMMQMQMQQYGGGVPYAPPPPV